MSKGSIFIAIRNLDVMDVRNLEHHAGDLSLSFGENSIDFWNDEGKLFTTDLSYLFECIERRITVGLSIWFKPGEDCFITFKFGKLDTISFSFDGLSDEQEFWIAVLANNLLASIPRDRTPLLFHDRNGEFEENFYEMLL